PAAALSGRPAATGRGPAGRGSRGQPPDTAGGPHPMTGAARLVSGGPGADQPSMPAASSVDVDSTTSVPRFDEVCDTVVFRGRASSATGMVRVSTPSL